MARCDFCMRKIEPGTGKLYIKKDGKTFDFCSKKCEIHMLKLKHKPRTTKWSLEFRRLKKEKLAHASSDSQEEAKVEAEKKSEKKSSKPVEKSSAEKKSAEKASGEKKTVKKSSERKAGVNKAEKKPAE